jgi:hypothetical protein
MVWVNAIGVAGLLAGDHRIAAAQRPRRDVALPINPSTFPSRRPLATGRHPEGAGEPVRRIRVAGPRRRLRHRLARPASHHRDVPAAPKRLTGHSTTDRGLAGCDRPPGTSAVAHTTEKQPTYSGHRAL